MNDDRFTSDNATHKIMNIEGAQVTRHTGLALQDQNFFDKVEQHIFRIHVSDTCCFLYFFPSDLEFLNNI
jgi:hypothetical protein